LVSVKKESGMIDEVKIIAEIGGETKLKLPFRTWFIASQKDVEVKNTAEGFLILRCKPGGTIFIKNGYE
jgi:alpha-L-fucosidase 2